MGLPSGSPKGHLNSSVRLDCALGSTALTDLTLMLLWLFLLKPGFFEVP